MNKFLVLSIITFLSLLVVSPVSAFSFNDLINVFLPQNNEKVVLNLDDGEVLNSEKYLSNGIKKKSEQVKIETQTKKIDNKKKISVKFLEKEQNSENDDVVSSLISSYNKVNEIENDLSPSSGVDDEVINKNQESNVHFRFTDIVYHNSKSLKEDMEVFFELVGDIEDIKSYKGYLKFYSTTFSAFDSGLIESKFIDIFDDKGNLKKSINFSFSNTKTSYPFSFLLKFVFEPEIGDSSEISGQFSYYVGTRFDNSISEVHLSDDGIITVSGQLFSGEDLKSYVNLEVTLEGNYYEVYCRFDEKFISVTKNTFNVQYDFSSCDNIPTDYPSNYIIRAALEVNSGYFDTDLVNNVYTISASNFEFKPPLKVLDYDHRTLDSILRDSGEDYENYLNEQVSSEITPSSYVVLKEIDEVDDVSCDFLPEKIRKIEEPLCNKAENDDEVMNSKLVKKSSYTSIPARFR